MSLHGRDEAVAEYRLPTASHRRQVRLAVQRTVCAVTVWGSGVRTMSPAVHPAAAGQTDCESASVPLHRRAVQCELPAALHTYTAPRSQHNPLIRIYNGTIPMSTGFITETETHSTSGKPPQTKIIIFQQISLKLNVPFIRI